MVRGIVRIGKKRESAWKFRKHGMAGGFSVRRQSRSVKAVKKESSFLSARARKENCIPERNLLWNHSF